jgi:DNA-binding beta-propeller fold protein YncE
VTDCVQDSAGNYYIGEYGENDRVQKFTKAGQFLLQVGSHGPGDQQFLRPQKLDIDAEDRLWIADACNHRIQVFDCRGGEAKLDRVWGTAGSELGQLRYPYDLALDGQGHVYVAEFGNSRIQKFDLAGKSLGVWGTHGRRPGELFNPWGVVRDSLGRLHVLDTYNHRVQRVWF